MNDNLFSKFASTFPTIHITHHNREFLYATTPSLSILQSVYKKNLIIRDRKNDLVLAQHLLDAFIKSPFLILKDYSKFIFRTGGTKSLYMFDLVETSKPPVLLLKSDTELSVNIIELDDKRHSITCDYSNNVLLIDNLTAQLATLSLNIFNPQEVMWEI